MLRFLKTKRQLAQALGLGTWTEVEQIFAAGAYRPISIRHKGKLRCVWAPEDRLKDLQRRLAALLAREYSAPSAVHGYLPGRSAITNAQQHCGRLFVLNVDLENFFQSIRHTMLIGILTGPRYKVRQAVAAGIAHIACLNEFLPPGSPCSPILSNMVMQPLDEELIDLSGKLRTVYTRLSDDMTISTSEEWFPASFANVGGRDVVIGRILQEAIERHGFHVNHNKTRLAHASQRQLVTGLVVNQAVSVPRGFTAKLKRQLHEWDIRGLASASDRFYEHRRIGDYRQMMLGRIQYVGAVQGFDNEVYKALHRAFLGLENRDVTEMNDGEGCVQW